MIDSCTCDCKEMRRLRRALELYQKYCPGPLFLIERMPCNDQDEQCQPQLEIWDSLNKTIAGPIEQTNPNLPRIRADLAELSRLLEELQIF